MNKLVSVGVSIAFVMTGLVWLFVYPDLYPILYAHVPNPLLAFILSVFAAVTGMIGTIMVWWKFLDRLRKVWTE